MKKTYIAPITNVVKMKYTTPLLNYSNTQAASDADVFGREAEFDDDEY